MHKEGFTYLVIFIVGLIFFGGCYKKEPTTVVLEEYEDGSVGIQKYYPDKKDTGTYIKQWFYPNGDTSSSLPFVDGKANGVLRCFYDDGQVEKLLGMKDALYHGKCITYHANGVIESISYYMDGKVTGDYYQYYLSGEPFVKRKYDNNGVENGRYYEWRENGTIIYTVPIVNDLAEGERLTFYPSGNLRSVSQWLDDEFHGQYIEYFDNGCCKHTGQIYCGENVGWWLEWDEETNVADSMFLGDIPDAY